MENKTSKYHSARVEPTKMKLWGVYAEFISTGLSHGQVWQDYEYPSWSKIIECCLCNLSKIISPRIIV